MASSDLTIEILKALRKEMRDRFDAVDKRFDAVDKRFDTMDKRFDVLEERGELTIQRLDITNERLDVVEATLLTLANQQRILAKHARDLGGRLDKVERR
jgi:hypothetical protein